MKLIKISLLSITPLIAMPASALFDPFSWFKSSQSDLKEIAERVRCDTKLQHLYRARIELENLEKIYTVNLPKNDVDVIDQKNKELLKDLESERFKINRAFVQAQGRWNLATVVYSGVNFFSFNKEVLEPALKKAEKEAKVSAKPVSPSWYEQLKKAESKLPKSERNKSTVDRKNEFKAWQTEYKAAQARKAMLDEMPQNE